VTRRQPRSTRARRRQSARAAAVCTTRRRRGSCAHAKGARFARVRCCGGTLRARFLGFLLVRAGSLLARGPHGRLLSRPRRACARHRPCQVRRSGRTDSTTVTEPGFRPLGPCDSPLFSCAISFGGTGRCDVFIRTSEARDASRPAPQMDV
jgi:hypothetical protein